MENNLAYCEQVAQLLEQKRTFLDNQALKKLRDTFQALQIYFENIFNILIRKGLIHEDPYKYEEKITEVDAPSDEAFSEAEENEKVSTRLSQYHTRLEFLNNIYEYSVDFLNFNRLKRITKFLKYINWAQLTETSPSPTGRVLAIYFSKIRMGTDQLSANLLNDSVAQIDKLTKTAFAILADLSNFQKETYKLSLRRALMPRLELTNNLAEDKIEAALQKARQLFLSSMGKDVPFYPELVKEVFIEDYTPAGLAQRQEILQALKIPEEKKTKEKKEIFYRQTLLQGVRYLVSCNLQLDDALAKIQENHDLLENQNLTLSRRLRRWLLRLVGRDSQTKIYEIEYFDVATSATKSERVSFQEFLTETKRLAQLFSSLASRTSQAYYKFESLPDERIFNFLSQNLINLQIAYRRLNGLMEIFKTDFPKERLLKLRSIKLELNTIKNSILKANQKKHEYVALKEEEEQLKRLGLKREINSQA